MLRTWTILVLLVVGCGGSEADAPRPEAGPPEARTDGAVHGDAALDASAPDASSPDAAVDAQPGQGDGSVTPSGLNRLASCTRYFESYCAMRWACFGDSQCQSNFGHCPDRFFSTGSTYTPDQLAACSGGWDGTSCADIAEGAMPTCAEPAGTRQKGEACIFANQCATRACSGTAGTCGQCVDPVPEGGACSTSAMCQRPLYCPAAPNAVCTKLPVARRPGVARREQACTGSEGCERDYTCVTSQGSNAGTCKRVVAGVSCAVTRDCVDGSYCPRVGERVCKVLPALGEACADALDNSLQPLCADGARCDDDQTCVPQLALGEERCRFDFDCADGNRCAEPSPQGYRRCLHYAKEGEPCAGMHLRCDLGLTCLDGACSPVASLGLFDAACAP